MAQGIDALQINEVDMFHANIGVAGFCLQRICRVRNAGSAGEDQVRAALRQVFRYSKAKPAIGPGDKARLARKLDLWRDRIDQTALVADIA